MSEDDGEDLVIDLTEFAAWDGVVPPEMVAADLALRNAEADAESDPMELEPAKPSDDQAQNAAGDPDLDSMNAYQRESWASEDYIDRAEKQRRLGLVIAYDREHSDKRPDAVLARSSWDEVPLDGILDAVAAGTFSLPTPTVGMLADGSAGLFYPGRVNGIAGESGAGKGWIALTVAAEQMSLGRHVHYLDFEDSPALAVLRLVKVLGVAYDLVRQFFHYLHPASHDEAGIASLVERVSLTAGAFVVIDSTGESIAAAGLNQNHDEEVARWFQDLAHPLASQGGACVLLLDHMVKSEDGGLWPIGSQRKRAAITGTQLVAEVAQPFSKSADGMVVLKVAKDRHGSREARSIASYVAFNHPIESTKTLPDGTLELVLSEALHVVFGIGKTADQVKADKDVRASRAMNADVAALDQLTPLPTSQRDVMQRMNWGAGRAMKALQEWRSRQPGSKP